MQTVTFFSGRGAPGAVVALNLDGKTTLRADVNCLGYWQADLCRPLLGGLHTLSARESTGGQCDSVRFRVLQVNLAPPVITSPVNGEIVTTATPIITGTATAGFTVTLCLTATRCVTVVADGAGAFAAVFPQPLVNGAYTLTAKQANGDCQESVNATVPFTVAV